MTTAIEIGAAFNLESERASFPLPDLLRADFYRPEPEKGHPVEGVAPSYSFIFVGQVYD